MKAFTLRLPDTVYEQIADQAAAQDRPMSRVILQHIRDGLARQTAATDARRVAADAYSTRRRHTR